MATLTVYSLTSDGYIESTDQDTGLVRSGSNLFVDDTSSSVLVGENANPSAYEGFLSFDTSAIPDDDDIEDVTLSVVNDNVPLDLSNSFITFETFAYDWGASLDTGDWQTPTELNSLTRCAAISADTITSSGPETRVSWGSDSAFVSNVSKTGETRLVQASDRTRNETGNFDANEIWGFYSSETSGTTNDPRLVVNHSSYTGPYQYLRPNADLAVTGWTDAGGGTTDLYTNIDEETSSDTDYVKVTP